jgi:tetratricopeptide (TPR) repeat protein
MSMIYRSQLLMLGLVLCVLLSIGPHLVVNAIVNLTMLSLNKYYHITATVFDANALLDSREELDSATRSELSVYADRVSMIVRLAPDEPTALVLLARLRASLGEYTAVADVLSPLLEKQPQYDLARLMLANVYHLTGQAEFAAVQYRHLLSTPMHPSQLSRVQMLYRDNLVSSELTSGRVAQRVGNSSDAFTHYQRVLQIQPGHLIALWEALTLATKRGDAVVVRNLMNELPYFELPTDKRLCDDSILTVLGLVESGIWSAEQGRQVMSILGWYGCVANCNNRQSAVCLDLISETHPILDRAKVLGLTQTDIKSGLYDRPNLAMNSTFDVLAKNVRLKRGMIEPQPSCWQWMVWDKPQHKKSLWYGGVERLGDNNVLRISGLWIDESGKGTAPAAGYTMCGAGVQLLPGQVARLSVLYYTSDDKSRVAIWLGNYHWLPPSRQWTCANISFRNASEHVVLVNPTLYLFDSGTVRFDDISLRVED